MRALAEVTVKVSDGTQLAYGGSVLKAGSEVSAPADVVERWVTRGWVEPDCSHSCSHGGVFRRYRLDETERKTIRSTE